MPVISAPHEFNVPDLFVDLNNVLGENLYLKCEGFNFAGSIKLKAAVEMIDRGERDGTLRPGMTLVESSSGNLGVALSLVARSKGYGFVCVTDSRCTLANRQRMENLGAQVRIITEPDPESGLLGARIRLVQELCASDAGYAWLNQYANLGNWMSHYRTTGPEIAAQFPDLDVLFIGAGTTGTLMGCARYFRENQPSVTVVAVDSVGSVTFGTPAAPRMIPGLGAGVRPQMLDESYVDAVVHVPETDTVRMCHHLVRHGYVLGGSTGTVLSGARQWIAENRPERDIVGVAVSPDLGDHYLDTVYQEKWLQDIYGLSPDELSGASRATA
ncbi:MULTISPECIES: 2,3-diaminopropionate biosynthesis protein SbnA [Streptomyces]|uniref:2,3-diaminopropionate biosynthesis protein SbnA n=2 Tax=Streptomyces rimosus subsp. rimosus TaxID=132474 RepID=L8EXT1_STRR1|nr:MULTISPECIES: 2,3-diaminopropionate biosynthesis protein SbnA [Streptomyces]KOG68738.1 cysteine synthase [Kitasatospora aureofaciens]MYT47442.1 2,3-diaminopropionate biosynthesis protein SbnA [Streptomyces sp. SID5471]KEF07887.1 cysteine synthase [Streptomyces rimosus]KUJ41823.1 2,3-diaminopropionate biosynthesis protein SbnA [Streptomyces rimosus subsp. rimosus]QDA05794.1 2,3-diaminopropionate biosynthesis protein SbnA [Streptomyces rimosus]